MAVRRDADDILETIRRKAGRPDLHIQIRLSGDRTTLISTNMSTEEASRWRRSGDAVDPANPFDGIWVADGTLLHQPSSWTVIAITPDGLNGIHFHENSGLDYRAQFDGKAYPVQNSRSDSVSLKLVNPGTVEVSWIRNGKTVETSREMVSADGKELTFSLESTLLEGTHHRLKYVYRKR